jgi:hypothetical protein
MKGFWTAATLLAALVLPAAWAAAEEKCLTCHEGIEKISEVPGMAELTCTDCHLGDAAATEKDAAHTGMYANPTDLRVVDQTCGTCHPDEVEKVGKSMHATMAGMISGTRYAWGAQGRETIYATYPVEDQDPQGENALKSLKQIPSYDPAKPMGPENSPGDDYLRNQCLRCHLWSDGAQADGDYRASGCAACHVLYSDEGTYEGGDKAILKDQKDRPRFHRITSKIPETQCIHCHNRGGRTGVSFIGTIESDGYGSPYTEKGGKQGKLHGKNYNHLTADVHYDKGLTCIDCHTRQDLHGDGNIYAKREQAVEIECQDCHGSLQQRSELKTSWGNTFNNLKKKADGSIVLTAKLTGKEHQVPQIKDAKYSSEGHAAMVAIPSHMEKMECYACHATWAPQCYGCHAKQDVGKTDGDWINVKTGSDPSRAGLKSSREKSAFGWEESRSYVRWESPTLGINSDGKVSPFIPGCQVFFTQMEGGKGLISNQVFQTTNGTSGIGTNPIQPHTVTKKARTCADCHMNPKALGLGSGAYDIDKNFPDGAPVDFELERIVDEEGRQLQQTAREGARPFNKEELQRMDRSGTCVACHGADAALWQKIKGKAGEAPTDELHRKGIEKLLRKAVKN